jgi:hypothetical protein
VTGSETGRPELGEEALSIALDEWHRQCLIGSSQIDAMRAVLAALAVEDPDDRRKRNV